MQRISVPLLFFYAAATIFLFSCKSSTCSKTVPCPGYTNSLLDTWFPYHDKQQVAFKSSVNQYDTFNLRITDSTLPYNYNTGYNRPDEGCSTTKAFSAALQKDTNNFTPLQISLGSHLDSYSTSPTLSAYISFANNSFNFANLTDYGFSSCTISSLYGVYVVPQTINNYSLNGTVYPIAQSIINDSAVAQNIPGVYKIIYAKNAGVIEFETNPGSIIWTKQ